MKFSYQKLSESRQSKTLEKVAAFPAFGKRFFSTLFLFIFSAISVIAQTTVTGTVSAAADKQPILGAAVIVKGTTTGTTTDENGKYSLTVADKNAVLVFQFIGFVTQEINLAGRTTVDVVLSDDSKALGEVVVIGYGTQKKKDLTGSIVSVTERDFQKGNIATPEQLIAGKMAGVNITPSTGAPGGGATIRIRGGASLTDDNPLIIVDGVPLENRGVSGIANPLSLINPNDIESVTVLKDASAAAIYGSRASNGVLMITTKKGKKGEKFQANFSSVLSLSTPTKFVPVLTGDELRALVNRVGNATQRSLLGSENTDWQSLIYRNAFSHDENLSFSGTVANLPYRLNLGYLNQEGILKTSAMDRKSLSLNINPRLFDDHLKVDLSYKGSFSKSDFADEGAIGAAVGFDPTQKPYTDRAAYQGYFEWLTPAGIPDPLAGKNPLGLLLSQSNVGKVNRHIANAVVDYKFHFLPDLRINMNVAVDRSNTNGTVRRDSTAASVFVVKGVNNTYAEDRTNTTFESYLNYVKELKGLKFDIMSGYGYQDFKNEQTLSFLNQNGVAQGDTNIARLRPMTQTTLVSFFGRANVGYKDRYLLTATLRRDGSSRLAPGYKWITYPAFAFAWRMTEDGIGKNWFANLKMRLGYGITGQQEGISEYNGLKTFSVGGSTVLYPFGNNYIQTIRPEAFNERLTWQKTISTNFGIDFTTKNERISGSIDYYTRVTEGLFAEEIVPAGVNFSNRIRSNVGTLSSSGVELTLNTTPIAGKKLNWDLNFVLAYYQNKITKLTSQPSTDGTITGIPTGGISGGVGNNIQLHSVGYAKQSFFVFQQVYDANGKPIEGVYVDRNKDGKITSDDKYLYQRPDPNYTLGITSNLTYDNFSFGFVLRGSIGNYMYNNRNAGGTFASNSLNYLYNPGRNVLETDFRNSQYFSDYYVENASFLRMDNLSLGYNLSPLFKNKYTVMLSAVAQNVFTITKYDGIDPEISGGIDNNIYLRPRTYSLGLNVRF